MRHGQVKMAVSDPGIGQTGVSNSQERDTGMPFIGFAECRKPGFISRNRSAVR